MSFGSEVKHEVTKVDLTENAVRAQLSAFIHINATMRIVNRQFQLQVEIENATIAKRFFSLIKERYNVEVDLQVLKRQNLRKNNIYRLRVKENVVAILEDLGIYSSRGLRQVPYSLIVVKEEYAQAYLAGCFLASGSVNSPTKPDYHLEVSVNSEAMADFVVKLMARFGLSGKHRMRRNRFVIYLKAADQIADFLKIIGAYAMTMEFEDVRIQRDFKNSLTRLDNCEVANEMKTIKAGNAQMDAIITLIEHNRFGHLDARLIEVGNLRMDYPEASLNELIEIYYQATGTKMSKSGLQHRFNKIIDLAQKLEEEPQQIVV